MKVKRHLFTVIGLATLALTACNNDDELQDGNNTLPEGAVHITANIDGVKTRALNLDADGKGNFAAGDVWGLSTFTGDATAPAYSNENIAYTYGTTVLYWKDLGESNVTFSAHYPHQTTLDGTEPVAYQFTLTDDREAADLLFSTATKNKDEEVALTFKHLMHNLVINLTADASVGVVDISTANISIPGSPNAIRVNLLTGEVDYAQTSGNTDYSHTGEKADMVLVPQDLTAGNEWITIAIGSDVWKYKVPASLNSSVPGYSTRLESGKRLTLNLTLKKTIVGTEVELTSSEITGWGTQGTVNDEITVAGPATITADQLKTALTATNSDRIVIDGDLTLSSDEQIQMGADHTLTINKGATLTIDKKGILGFSNNTMRTLTITGGGTLLTRNTEQYGVIFQNGNLNLADITLRMEGGVIFNANIEVRDGATLLLNDSQGTPINLANATDKTITVNTGGKIEINSFMNGGIGCAGTLLIDGGTVSINGLGTRSDRWQELGRNAYAVELGSNHSKLQIRNNGKLVSTVTGGTVFLAGKFKIGDQIGGGCKVQGVSGLFKAGSFTLNTNDETEVSFANATDALRDGVYKWDGSSMFVWDSIE